jgi:hypothetical protein
MAAWVMPAIAVGAQLLQGMSQSGAAAGAAGAQTDEMRRQYEAMRSLLQPYVQAGAGALEQQQALIGIGPAGAQEQAISALEASPQFQALTQQGENALLQQASATGGLRGGNIQGALAQFRPQMLSELINQQYSRLGGLSALGQASAAGVGGAGMQAGQQIGAAQAGGVLGQARGFGQMINAIPQGIGMYYGQTGQYPWQSSGLTPFGTIPGSQQSQMLAQQNAGF